MDFDDIYKQYAPQIYRVCMGYTNNPDQAKDLVQETFFSVWRNLSSFRNEARVSTWIFRIATNHCLRALEIAKRMPAGEMPYHLAATETTPPDDKLALLYKCIAELPETERIIISLELEDMPQAEIAQVLGLSDVNIRVKVHRIRKNWLKNLKRMDNLNELKAIWHSAGTPNLPAPSEMKHMIKSFQTERVRKKWMVIILSTLIAAFMFGTMIWSGSKMVSTWLGGTLIATACMLLAVDNWRSLKRFNQLDNCSNREFWAFIDRTRENQLRYYKKTQLRIMSLSVTGLMLYLYEPATRRPLYTGVLFAVTVIYWLLMWFVVRPRLFAKNAAKLNRIKEHYQKLAQQFEGDEE